jgi:hypothetical protein
MIVPERFLAMQELNESLRVAIAPICLRTASRSSRRGDSRGLHGAERAGELTGLRDPGEAFAPRGALTATGMRRSRRILCSLLWVYG